MKKILNLFLFLSSTLMVAQIQNNAPWMNTNSKGKVFAKKETKKLTIKEIEKNARAYFQTIDKNKKGSGLKPFERWNYHWGFYTNPDGTIKPATDLWSAWEQKNQMKKNQTQTDVSDWKPLGPYNNSDTSTSTLKQSGQGRVNAIAVDPQVPTTLYVGAPAGGIWKSIDNGASWKPLTDHLPQIGVSGIAIHPTNSNIIYIATGDDDASDSYSVGVWKSIDGGASWTVTGSMGGSSFPGMNEIYIHPTSPETVLVATGSGIFKSINGGTTWINKYNVAVSDLKMKPGDPTVWYATTNNLLLKSIDSGETFTPVALPTLSNSAKLILDVSIANPNYVYVLSAKSIENDSGFNGLWKSTNSGVSFVKTAETNDIFNSTQAWYDLALTVSSNNANIVYVGVLDIWKSTNGGDSFESINDWGEPEEDAYTHADIHFMRFMNGKFYVGSDGGIYVSENEGVNFTDLTKGLAISQFYKISVSPKNYNKITGGLQDNGGFALNDNAWRNYHGGDGMEGVIDPTAEDTSYGFVQYGGALIKTIDGGRTTVLTLNAPEAEVGENEGDEGGEWVTPLASNSKGEIFSAFKSLYKIVDNKWVKTSTNVFGGDINNLEIDPKNDNNMYLSLGSELYKSINGGVDFSLVPFTLSEDINGIEVSNSTSNTVWVITNSKVYKSENILNTTPVFTELNSNLPTESKAVIKHHERSGNNTLYLGTTLGVYTYNDTSNTWATYDNKLPNVKITDLEVQEEDSKLIVATYGRGIFITDIPRVLPANDVRALTIKQLPVSVACNNSITPAVEVKNQGNNVISALTINYKYNNVAKPAYNWTGTINSNATEIINLPTETLAFGNYILEVETIISGDAFVDNNKSSQTFFVNKGSTTPTTINSFENLEDEFLIGASNDNVWELGLPTKALIKTVPTGSKAYVSKLSGNYPVNSIGYLYTHCYNLSLITSPVLSFKMAFDLDEQVDYLVFEYSTDSGVNWSILGNATDNNWYNSSDTEDVSGITMLPGKQWTGFGESNHSSGGKNADYRTYSYDLAEFSNQVNINFRFKLVSDSHNTNEGVAIDDFVINGTLSTDNNDKLSNGLIVYPNPSKKIFNFKWDLSGNAKISVYNYLGQKVAESKNVTNKTYQLNLNNNSKGIYFAKINVGGKQAVKKIILE